MTRKHFLPITLFCLLCLFLTNFVHAQNKNFLDQPYLEVAGNADTLVTPDEIYLRIQISEADTKGKISVEELEQKMVNALKALGLDPEKNLTTRDLASNFQSYFLRGKQVLKSKDYVLKVATAVQATQVLMSLADLGISNISVDHVDYSHMQQVRNLMLSRAVQDARTKALAMVQPLHQSLGKAIHIVETNAYPIRPLQANTLQIEARGFAADQSAQLPQIDFEKIKIETSVQVVFTLE
ncbi:MAG: SIMPL domain-containing protein [Thermoflavifilum sp.]|nr:SIMPL domain-containing protein [Thermoflavifilum sp.]